MFSPQQKALDIFGILLSAPQLAQVNIVYYRILRLRRTVDYMTIVTTPRNGKSGAGIMIIEPWARCQQKNVLAFDWIFPIISFECPSINDLNTGTNLTAYELAQNVADILHNYADQDGTLNIDGEAIQDETQWELEGCISKRTNLHTLGKNNQTPRVGQIQNSIAGGLITLSCADNPSAEIYYTTNGTFPSMVGGAVSKLYSHPVNAISGQTFRAVGYQIEFNGSACMTIIIP